MSSDRDSEESLTSAPAGAVNGAAPAHGVGPANGAGPGSAATPTGEPAAAARSTPGVVTAPDAGTEVV